MPKTLIEFADALTEWGLTAWVERRWYGYRVVAGPRWSPVELLRYRAGSLSYLWWKVGARGHGLKTALVGAIREPRFGRFLIDMRHVLRVRP